MRKIEIQMLFYKNEQLVSHSQHKILHNQYLVMGESLSLPQIFFLDRSLQMLIFFDIFFV